MIDHIAASYLTVRHGGLVDTSARPDAPVVVPTERRPRAARARARLAAQLHRVAAVLEPQPQTERRLTRGASPACQ
jgi:hypothetical protein